MPAALSAERSAADREALLDTAESLFYARGIQSVGMDEIRESSGLSLKRIYSMFPAKEDLVVAMLRRRDRRWRGELAAAVAGADGPSRRVLAAFDWLHDWFAEPGFRGCAWINIHGELGAASPAVREEVRSHKRAFREQLAALMEPADPDTVDAIHLLAEGAIVTAAIDGNPAAARVGRDAAERLLASAAATAP